MTKKRINPLQIRAEIEANANAPRSIPVLVDKLLSCNHHALVSPGLDPAKAICEGCKQNAMRSGDHRDE